MNPNVVYTGGTFDIIHAGHIHLFKRCRELSNGGKVVVSLNTDEFIKKYKGKAPIMSYAERAEILRSIKYIDAVVENFGGADSKPAIEDVDPDIIAVGDDWRGKDYYAQMQFSPMWLDSHGIELVYVDRLNGYSSTDVRQRVLEREHEKK